MDNIKHETAPSKTHAFAGGDLDAIQPDIKHFNLLDDAAAFLKQKQPPCRAVGFFGSRLDAPEHTVFLTVAKQVDNTFWSPSEWHPLALKLGRANVGRGTSGATIYIVPPASGIYTSNESEVTAGRVLTYQYRVPSSPQDETLPERWQALHKKSASPPSPPKMWQQVLEAEAMEVDRFLRRGAMANVVPFANEKILTDSLAHSVETIGLLLLPPRRLLSDAMNKYHMSRLKKLGERFPPLRCKGSQIDSQTQDGNDEPWAAWLNDHVECTHLPSREAVRFAHAESNNRTATALGKAFGVPLISLLGSSFSETEDRDSIYELKEPRLAVLRRKTSFVLKASWMWHAHLYDGQVGNVEKMWEFVKGRRDAEADAKGKKDEL